MSRQVGLTTVTGLAYSDATALPYAYDAARNEIHAFVSRDGFFGTLVTRPTTSIAGGVYEELTCCGGELYASYAYAKGQVEYGQLRRIDLATGGTVGIVSVVPDVSPQSLLINHVGPASRSRTWLWIAATVFVISRGDFIVWRG
ncbi:MAG: hypothetical protein VYE68_00375 [Acidobacteriota bacterium]|nr:hypothetical protein [Acidobacteriota bacterium]